MYLDFRKLFDKISNERLVCKIKAHWIEGNVGTDRKLVGRQETTGHRRSAASKPAASTLAIWVQSDLGCCVRGVCKFSP